MHVKRNCMLLYDSNFRYPHALLLAIPLKNGKALKPNKKLLHSFMKFP